jgi:hypothetical protein
MEKFVADYVSEKNAKHNIPAAIHRLSVFKVRSKRPGILEP